MCTEVCTEVWVACGVCCGASTCWSSSLFLGTPPHSLHRLHLCLPRQSFPKEQMGSILEKEGWKEIGEVQTDKDR